jgi:hypothetical protein
MSESKPSNDRTVLLALFGMSLAYPVAGIVLSALGVIPAEGFVEFEERERGLVTLGFMFAGLLTGVSSFVLPKLLARNEPDTGRIVAMALAEGASLLGLVLLAVLGDLMIPCVLWAVGVASGVQHLRGN